MAMNLAEEIGQNRRGRHQPTHIYYRQPNGWITSGMASQIERAKFQDEGWEPLPQYGLFDILYEYIGDHPLEVLFMRGGAKELSVAQIVESGFWMDPPTIPVCETALYPQHTRHTVDCWRSATKVEFSQVPSDTPRSFECRFCERLLPTAKARDQHEGVMHQKERGDLRTGDSLATSLVKGLRQSGVEVSQPPPLVPSEPSPGVEVSQPEPIDSPDAVEPNSPTGQTPYACGICSRGFRRLADLKKHVKGDH